MTTFKLDTVFARAALDGFDGVRYANRLDTMPKPEAFQTEKPSFNKSAVELMSPEDREFFDEEMIARGEFLDAKKNLAGTREVSAYEDAEIIPFDPLKDLDQKKAGFSSYNSGRHQGGTSGATYVRPQNVYAAGRSVTLERQDPYAVKLAAPIKIKM